MARIVHSLRIMVDSSIANKSCAFTMKALGRPFTVANGDPFRIWYDATGLTLFTQLMSFFRNSGKSKKEIHSSSGLALRRPRRLSVAGVTSY